MAILLDPAFWVAIGFIVFVALVARPAARMVTGELDKRADKIRADLEEAEKLREEAQDLLAGYQRKQRDAVKEADAIVEHAKEEAQRMARQAEERLEASIERRRKQALDRLRQAEQAALDRVRNHTIDVAIAAARDHLAKNFKGRKADALVEQAIKDLPKNLH